ncbi:MAG: glucokinase, partial [Desulfovibrionaceae bacterium]|nr:glucokinase [Desulfovibrionaceae bacterium]
MILWVADIGGTNCRIAEFGLDETKRNAENTSWPTPQDLRLNQDFEVKTSDINSDQDLIACFESYFAKKVTETEGLGLAVAGPIQGDSAKLTNAKLSLNATKLHSNFKVKTVLLLNDFMAQAYACAEPLEQDLLPIGEPRKVSRKVRAILGVGTGLGCAMLVPQGNMDWKGLGSEAGHMPFGFKASEEDFAKWLKARLKKELL